MGSGTTPTLTSTPATAVRVREYCARCGSYSAVQLTLLSSSAVPSPALTPPAHCALTVSVTAPGVPSPGQFQFELCLCSRLTSAAGVGCVTGAEVHFVAVCRGLRSTGSGVPSFEAWVNTAESLRARRARASTRVLAWTSHCHWMDAGPRTVLAVQIARVWALDFARPQSSGQCDDRLLA